MPSPAENPLTYLEPHHRPLVWAGGAAFFGFPLLSGVLPGDGAAAAVIWLLPAVLLSAIALSAGKLRYAGPLAIIAFSLSAGWFLSGTAALRLDHQAALRRPRISAPAGNGGVICGVAGGDARPGKGSEYRIPLHLERFTSDGGEKVAASGILELRLRGGETLSRGSGVAVRLSREDVAALAAGGASLSAGRGRVTVTPPARAAARLRGRLRLGILASFRRMGEPAGGLAAGLLLGERSALDPGLLKLMRRAGAMHLLALSGMHLAILAALLGAILFPLLGRLSAAVAALLLVFYFWIVGPIPSLLRALLMFSLGAIVKLRGARIDARTLLAAALLIGLVAAPELATGVGWRLSTLALLGILWFGLPLWGRGLSLPPRRLWSLFSVSFGAFLLTTPVSLELFGEAYPASILSSMLLTPVVLIVIWFSLLSAPLLSILPSLTLPLGSAGASLYHLLEAGARLLAKLPPLSDGRLIWPLLLGGSSLLLLVPWLRFLLLSFRRSRFRREDSWSGRGIAHE